MHIRTLGVLIDTASEGDGHSYTSKSNSRFGYNEHEEGPSPLGLAYLVSLHNVQQIGAT